MENGPRLWRFSLFLFDILVLCEEHISEGRIEGIKWVTMGGDPRGAQGGAGSDAVDLSEYASY